MAENHAKKRHANSAFALGISEISVVVSGKYVYEFRPKQKTNPPPPIPVTSLEASAALTTVKLYPYLKGITLYPNHLCTLYIYPCPYTYSYFYLYPYPHSYSNVKSHYGSDSDRYVFAA